MFGYLNQQQPIQNKLLNLQGKVIDNLEVVKATDISLRAVPAVPTPTDPVTPITTQVPIIINANIVLDRVLESAPRRTPIWMNV